MSKKTSMEVAVREGAGKGAARALRREGLVPGVIYGDKKPPVMISVNPLQLKREMSTKGFWTRQFDLNVGGKKHTVLCQDVQRHVVSDTPIHIDFLRISKDSILTLDIPVRLINEDICVGIKRGGTLNIVRRTVEVNCKAANIPDEFVFDLAKADLNDSIHISAIELPKGVVPTISDRDFTIASIAVPSGIGKRDEEEAEGEEGAEAEAEGENKEEK